MGTKADKLVREDLEEDYGGDYGIGLILSEPTLLLLAYQAQGYKDAEIIYNEDGSFKKIKSGKISEGEEWTDAKIDSEIRNSDWYGTYDANVRLATAAKESGDPTWTTQISNIVGTLERKAVERGANIEGVDLNKIAEEILTNNYTYVDKTPDGSIPDSILDSYLTPLIVAGQDGTFKGQAEISAQTLREYAEKYGVSMSDKWFANAIQSLDSNATTLVDLQNEIINNARETWPTLDGISSTRSTMDIADSYIQRMANVWEMDPDTISLETPEIKKALVGVDADGNPYRQTMWEFEQSLRNDPRWDGTEQGQRELGEGSMMMLKELGFWK